MPIIETEIWKPNPERPGTIVFDSQRVAQDIFTEMEAHLKADGRLPDEYFLFDAHGNWKDGALFPKDAEILCNTNYGGSEGIYLDVFVRYEKEVYEHGKDNGVLGWHKRMVTEHFATGKTLGDSIEDLDKMNLVASSVMAAFYGNKNQIRERYAEIESGKAEQVYLLPTGEQKSAETAVCEETVPTTRAINGDIACFDIVLSTGDSDYPFLVGEVNAVEKLGSPEHDSGNATDDVFVDFRTEEYSEQRMKEIEAHFSNLYGESKLFDDLPLDNVIMSPDNLIRIKESDLRMLLESRANCEAFCNKIKPPDKSVRAAAKPKTIADKLQAGKEKAEAYKAQNPPVATKNNNKEID